MNTLRPLRAASLLLAMLLPAARLPALPAAAVTLAPSETVQLNVPDGLVAPEPGALFLSNEPALPAAAFRVTFDLENLPFATTPFARLQLRDVSKARAKRPGQSPSQAHGALHAFAVAADGAETLAASLPVKPGTVNIPYPLDVTDAVAAALAKPAGQRRLTLAVRVTGQPLPFEIYTLRPTAAVDAAAVANPALDIIPPPDGWRDNWKELMEPLATAPVIREEAFMPVAPPNAASKPLAIRTLYPVKKIIEIRRNDTRLPLVENRDYTLAPASATAFLLPASGLILPDEEFFMDTVTAKDGTSRRVRKPYILRDAPKFPTWYHDRQIAVTYEPLNRDTYRHPPRLSSLADLPRTAKILREKRPLKLIIFGDSISWGANSGRLTNANPWQPDYATLFARKLRETFGVPLTFMNHSRGGATSAFAATQAAAQVAAFKPNLVVIAYGMNDRNRENTRSGHGQYLRQIIETVRAASPETEFILVASMLNNPRQSSSGDLSPIKNIAAQTLAVTGPGIAHVDMTGTHLALLARKDYLDTSGNGANHPNDFLMRLYAQRLWEIFEN